jgi:hypothetical protein
MIDAKTFSIEFLGIPQTFVADDVELTVKVPESFHDITFTEPKPITIGEFKCTFVDDDPRGPVHKVFEKWAELLYGQPLPIDPLREFRDKASEAISDIQTHDFEVNKVFTCNIAELEHWSSGIPDKQFLRDYTSGTVVVFVPMVKPFKYKHIQDRDKQLIAYLSKLAGKKVTARYSYALVSKFEKNGVEYSKPDLVNNFIIIHTLKYGYPKSIGYDSLGLSTEFTSADDSLIATTVLDTHAGYSAKYFDENSIHNSECNAESNGEN